MTFKALKGLVPGYLSELLTPYRHSCNLRSSTANFLLFPDVEQKPTERGPLQLQHPIYGTNFLPQSETLNHCQFLNAK